MIREMFLYYYGEHSQDVYNYEIGMGGVGKEGNHRNNGETSASEPAKDNG